MSPEQLDRLRGIDDSHVEPGIYRLRTLDGWRAMGIQWDRPGLSFRVESTADVWDDDAVYDFLHRRLVNLTKP